MHFDWSTLAMQAVNVLILCWLLQRFLYKPVLAVMDQRRHQVEQQLADAAEAKATAAAALAAIEERQRTMADEHDALLAAAIAQADAKAAERLADAQRQAWDIINNGRKAVEVERQRALADARHSTLQLAAAMAERLLAGTPPALRAAAWIDQIERQLAALPEAERATLGRQLGAGDKLRVITAETLPAESEAAWRLRITTALGIGAAVEFAVDPALVGGAELVFPGAILRLSWKDALDVIRQQLETDHAAN